MVRAQELLVQASSTSTGDTGRMAIASDLRGIRETLSVLLNETDYQGIPVFDDGTPTRIPVGRGIQLEAVGTRQRSEEHTSELQSLMRISYAVFCLKKKTTKEEHR